MAMFAADLPKGAGRVHLAQHSQMFMDLALAFLRKINDVGKVRTDSVHVAQPHDVFVTGRPAPAILAWFCLCSLSLLGLSFPLGGKQHFPGRVGLEHHTLGMNAFA